MRRVSSWIKTVHALGVAILICSAGRELAGAQTYVYRTNWAETWVTNTIEVRMPSNRFAALFRTNWVEQTITNIVDVYATNWLTANRTNTVTVDAWRTNIVEEFKTNWQTITQTKEVPVLLSQTNIVTVAALRTNVQEEFKTNWQTVTLTNHTEILLTRTNATSAPTSPLRIEATKTPKPASRNQIELELTVRWTGEKTDPPLHVEQWRIESEDGSVRMVSPHQVFKDELPPGRYRVEVRARQQEAKPALVATSTLTVTPNQASIQ